MYNIIYFDNQRGSALILVLFLIIIITELVALIYLNTELNFKLSANMGEYKQAIYAAEAGINYGRSIIKKNNGIPLNNPDGSKYVEGDQYGKKICLDENISFIISFKTQSETKILISSSGKYQDNCEKISKIVIINK